MKFNFYLLLVATLLVVSCAEKKTSTNESPSNPAGGRDLSQVNLMDYANTITAQELEEQLYIYAADSLEGRDTGKEGQKKAVRFLRDKYIEMGVSGGMSDGSYFQTVPGTAFNRPALSSENVLAFIEGTELPGELIVMTAHLDHVGMENGEVYNGADDDGSGTIALVEIAEAFKKAKDDGYGPKRSILILHVTGEEIGLKGSKYYVENPVYPLENTVANLNIDMIGRVDDAHTNTPDYVYLIGSDRLSQELHDLSEEANSEYINMTLDYTFNAENDPNRYYYRSDHYNFARNNIPVIFYFNGVHDDYHAPTDTPDKIDYPLLQRRAQLIFATAWKVANADTRPALN